MRIARALGLLAVLAWTVEAEADVIYRDTFTAPDNTPVTTYSPNYTVTNATGEIIGRRLRVHSATDTGQRGVSTVPGLFGTPGAGAFVKGHIWYSWPSGGGASNVFLKLGGNVAHRTGNQNRHGFWDGG